MSSLPGAHKKVRLYDSIVRLLDFSIIPFTLPGEDFPVHLKIPLYHFITAEF